ncbi:MAG TPA: hypothetical protein VHL57_06600, partial [Flavobacteriales bacterium]|nr:hypothetical protein [Flavobacteriales bacterium]
HPGTCANHLPEQLDPSLVPLDRVLPFRPAALAAAAVLAISGVQAQQRVDPAPTEQQPTPLAKESLQRSEQGPGAVRTRNGHLVCPVPEPSVPKSRYRWYISKRFPFFHHARRIRTVGCPSF